MTTDDTKDREPANDFLFIAWRVDMWNKHECWRRLLGYDGIPREKSALAYASAARWQHRYSLPTLNAKKKPIVYTLAPDEQGCRCCMVEQYLSAGR